MAENLKDKYLNEGFFLQLSVDLKTAYPPLNKNKFYQQCIKPLDQLELKERLTHTTLTVAEHLPNNYKQAIKILYEFSEPLDDKFGYIFMPEFVATFGMNDYSTSIKALRDFTKYSSSELAIRDFLNLDFDRTIKHMLEWTEHDDRHVRRLASEGSRPRLPWASKLQQIIDKPTLTWKILNRLKADPSKYVQKSVANHLNDISKDNPEWMISKISRWNTNNEATAWIVNHGCRTLIKQGDTATLTLMGYKKPNIEFKSFSIENKNIKLGKQLEFRFSIINKENNPQDLIIDYRIHFLKKNNSLQAKTFKLKKVTLENNENRTINKNHTLKIMTTRKLYPGKHEIEVIINGESFGKEDFILST